MFFKLKLMVINVLYKTLFTLIFLYIILFIEILLIFIYFIIRLKFDLI